MTRSVAGWEVCGATCAGPAHRHDKVPNQDRWCRTRSRFGMVVVVCDGLGSAEQARFGATAACAAVTRAVPLWLAHDDASDDQLIRLIHVLWAMRVNSYGQRNCATTCLFGMTLPAGGVLLGQLGDGIILLEAPDASVSPLVAPRKRFGNETTGLGIATDIGEWTIRRFPPDAIRLALLATDGVADDILDSERSRFVRHFRDEILTLPPPARGAGLRRTLRAWPTPGHIDDKTLALLWRAQPSA